MLTLFYYIKFMFVNSEVMVWRNVVNQPTFYLDFYGGEYKPSGSREVTILNPKIS